MVCIAKRRNGTAEEVGKQKWTEGTWDKSNANIEVEPVDMTRRRKAC